MKKAVKILSIVALIAAIVATVSGFFVRVPVIQLGNAIYSLVVGLLSIFACAKKKPSIVLGVFACLDFGNPWAFLCGVLMIVLSILNKKLAAKEEAEAEVEVEEYAEEEYVEYAE